MESTLRPPDGSPFPIACRQGCYILEGPTDMRSWRHVNELPKVQRFWDLSIGWKESIPV